MNSLPLSKAVLRAISDPDFTIKAQKPEESLYTGAFEIQIDHLERAFNDAAQAIHKTTQSVRQGNIDIMDLKDQRAAFYTIKDQLKQLHQDQQKEVEELKSESSWHERSRLVRIFLKTEAGDRFEQEQKEAQDARSAVIKFREELEDLETSINNSILELGCTESPTLAKTVNLWKAVGGWLDDGKSAHEDIERASSSFRSYSQCQACGNTVTSANQRSGKYLDAAANHLADQNESLNHWYSQLSQTIDETVEGVRVALGLDGEQ